MTPASILIVGAGFSGSLTALHLLRRHGRVRVALAEREDAFGPGLAYGRAGADHLLNVRAANMSAFPDAPSHFLDWLRTQGEAHGEGDSFVRRSLYGAYVQQQLREAATGAGAAGRLVLVGDGVTSLTPLQDGRLEAAFSMGRREVFDRVVLAIGNPPPARPACLAGLREPHPRYVGDPWAPGALSRIGPDDRVLLLGAGLTMVDVADELAGAGSSPRLLALSRRGLIPRRHAPASVSPTPSDVFSGPLSRRLNGFRRAAKAADWRGTFDALRPHTEMLWRSLSEAERRRFLRHLRPYWDAHRHRQAPPVAERTDALLASGRLAVRAARLVGAEPEHDRLRIAWRARGETWTSSAVADWLINCTGSEGALGRIRDALVQALLARGLVRQDPLGLGLDVTDDGAVVAADGSASPRLTAIGPLTRGAFWESTAVPDLRTKAAALAAYLTPASSS